MRTTLALAEGAPLMVHPSDQPRLEEFIDDAAPGPIVVRLRDGVGTWRSWLLTAEPAPEGRLAEAREVGALVSRQRELERELALLTANFEGSPLRRASSSPT